MGAVRFRQHDVTRLLRAAKRAGVAARVEVGHNGKLVLISEPVDHAPASLADDKEALNSCPWAKP